MVYATHELTVKIALNLDEFKVSKESKRSLMMVLGIKDESMLEQAYATYIVNEINQRVLLPREETTFLLDGNITEVQDSNEQQPIYDEDMQNVSTEWTPDELPTDGYDELAYAQEFTEEEPTEEYPEPQMITPPESEYNFDIMEREDLEEKVRDSIYGNVDEIRMYAGEIVSVYVNGFEEMNKNAWKVDFPVMDMEPFAPDLVTEYDYIIVYDDVEKNRKTLKEVL